MAKIILNIGRFYGLKCSINSLRQSSNKLLSRMSLYSPAVIKTQVCGFTVSHHRQDLMEFFDHKEHLGEETVRVGRPWRKDELRLKSNTDLHKLWYVLLKERNMLMTMEEEYKRCLELFPSPERLEKVEESMENILDVVAERDRAYNMLETGETGEPGKRWLRDQLGRGYWRKEQEHLVPMHLSGNWKAHSDKPQPLSWQLKYKKLEREQLLKRHSKQKVREIRRRDAIRHMYPDAELDDES